MSVAGFTAEDLQNTLLSLLGFPYNANTGWSLCAAQGLAAVCPPTASPRTGTPCPIPDSSAWTVLTKPAAKTGSKSYSSGSMCLTGDVPADPHISRSRGEIFMSMWLSLGWGPLGAKSVHFSMQEVVMRAGRRLQTTRYGLAHPLLKASPGISSGAKFSV